MAQTIPGRHIVELNSGPAAAVSARKSALSPRPTPTSRLDAFGSGSNIASKPECNLSAAALRTALTLLNAMAVPLSDQAVAQSRQVPNVKNVYPVKRHHLLMDHVVNVHRMSQAWESAGRQSFLAIPSNEELEAVVYLYGDTAGIVDVGAIGSDSGGYGCSALPSNGLTNKIALTQRGTPDGITCTFQTKLNNAQNALAAGAIIYDNTRRAFFDYTMSGVTPAPFQLGLDNPPRDSSGATLCNFGTPSQGTNARRPVSNTAGRRLIDRPKGIQRP